MEEEPGLPDVYSSEVAREDDIRDQIKSSIEVTEAAHDAKYSRLSS